MKVIFLDIDGVLNSVKSMQNNSKLKYPDTPCIENIGWLNYIIEKTNAKIVLSSTWRLGNSSLMLDQYLNLLGVIGEVIDKTPHLDSYRGTEIKCWLLEHASKIVKYKDSGWLIYKEPVESFVIIDDDSDMEDLKDKLVLVNNSIGLTKEDAEKAIGILNA